MKLIVIDSQGGKLGKLLVEGLKGERPDLPIIALGTNAIATAAMLRAGADQGATGENPIVYNCRDADVILGPIGILCANSMLGEITPNMAVAIGASPAKRVLIPFSHCDNIVAGVSQQATGALIQSAVRALTDLAAKG